MQILCCAELCNNISRYDGVKFGYRASGFRGLNELYTKSRTEALGPDAKLAALIGAMVLSQDNYSRYYDKAMRIRRLVKESLGFDKYDLIILPAGDGTGTCGDTPAAARQSSANGNEEDSAGTTAGKATALAQGALPRLCGLPAVTVPYQKGAITLIADTGREDVLSSALKAVGL
jgi:Asp-tRNA(Asn)/Glu-tRNA(Gln) amidotransferase A subunit family amidase